MKRNTLFTMSAVLLLFSLACSLAGTASPEPTLPVSQNRCGDLVCDGPENAQNCPADCAAAVSNEEEDAGENGHPEESPNLPSGGEVTYGYVYATITLDRTAGTGDCGVDPWYSSDCSVMKIWWDMHAKAFASAFVMIVPDGQDRWVITNQPEAAAKYGVTLAGGGGEYQSITLNPGATNPECSGSIEGKPFDFQVMGTRENGLTELILSANPVEHAWGSCMQAGFDWEVSHLLYGWAVALSGDPNDLRLQLNDTFREQAGQYTFTNTVDTNPSPENRDHVNVELGFLCTGSASSGTAAPVACPWEQ
jgi:hypothetical protein